MGTNQFGYAYDPIGNRTTASNNNEATTYAANTLNQYTNIMAGAIQVPQYDLDGNLTNYNGWTFVWDAENRLISAEQVGTAVPDVRIAYDYMSRRIEKAVNGVTNRFVYDGWDLISETTSTGITNVYVWGVDLSGSLQGSGGIGGLVSVTMSGAGVPPATYIPCYDANGNITDYVDTNSTVVAHREFDAFGNTTVATGPQVNDFNFWFSTKYLDQETGLYYYGYRFLSTDWGRWVNRDPITEGGGLNLNCFVNNNSLANVDANGLWILGPVNPGNDVPPIVESPPPRPPIQPGPRKCCGYASYNTITQCCCESTKKIHDLGSPFQWSGTIAYSEFGYYLQFTAMNCDLKSNIRSDCKRFTVNITAFLGGLTYGPAYGGAFLRDRPFVVDSAVKK
jgi:RHS repeat-associated protein